MMNCELSEDVLADLTLPADIIFNGSFFLADFRRSRRFILKVIYNSYD